MTSKILSLAGCAAFGLLAACGGATTTTLETTPEVLVPATRTVPVYEEVEIETPDTPETPETPEAVESPDVEIEIDVDD